MRHLLAVNLFKQLRFRNTCQVFLLPQTFSKTVWLANNRSTQYITSRPLSVSNKMASSLKEIVEELEAFAPLEYAEPWDNVGLLIEPKMSLIETVMLTNDLTELVLKEAVSKKCEMIISYHPPIFSGIKRITKSDWKGRLVTGCIESRIAVYSPHTSWDNTRNGIADWLCDALPHTQSIIMNVNAKNADYGSGRFAIIPSENVVTVATAMESVKKHLGICNVHLALGIDQSLDTRLRSFAVCPGSGSSVLNEYDADLYITGEMSHHEVLAAVHKNTTVILCNHSNSERGFLEKFKKILKEQLPDLKIIVSEADEDPIVTH